MIIDPWLGTDDGPPRMMDWVKARREGALAPDQAETEKPPV